MLTSNSVFANTYCAHSAAELKTVLAEVSTGGAANDQSNTILLVSGTFVTIAKEFAYLSASAHALTLEGGYDSNCASQDPALGSSILDGNHATIVLSVATNGSVTVRHLTIQNGADGGASGAGVRISATDVAASAVFDSNVVRGNVSTYAAGGLSATGSGTVRIQNNLFVGNTGVVTAAFATGMSAGATAYITNNTVVANVTTHAAPTYTMALGNNDPSITIQVSNTISFGNTATFDYYLYGFQTAAFNNNDYGSIDGLLKPGSDGNLINIDPQFVGAGDYHLLSTSPLLRRGLNAPVGGLPVTDIEGNARSIGGNVDLGAFENADAIFANAFEAD